MVVREALGLATELVQLLESVGDSFLTVSLCTAYLNTILAGGQIAAVLRLADRVVGLVEGNPREGELISVSPLANALGIRGTARWCLGLPGWRDDFDRAMEAVAAIPPQFRSGTFYIIYLMTIPNGVLVSREPALAEIAEIASAAEQFGEQVTVDLAQTAHGITLVYRGRSERDIGADLLEELHEAAQRKRLTIPGNLPLIDIHVARERGRRGDIDSAVELARNFFDTSLHSAGEAIWLGTATAVLVELLLQRGSDADLREARAAIARLAGRPTDPGVVLYEIWLLRLRALLAQAEGDKVTYRDCRDRYRTMANDLGFEGHMKWAAEMV